MALLGVGSVQAEGGCPAGMIPAQGTNISTCAPISGGNGVAAESAGPRWLSRWGAIAQDPDNRVMGAAAERESKREAKKLAMESCLSRGGVKCKVLTVYTNQCLVTVQGVGAANDAMAESIERATKMGMDVCRKRGDSDCHVYYQACSLPLRIR